MTIISRIYVRFFMVLNVMLFGTSSAFALTMGQYREWQRDPIKKEMLGTYTAGIGQGISFSNVYNKSKNLPLIFCPPNELPITGDLTNAVLEVFITKNKFKPSDEIPIIMIFALKDAYPC